MLPPTGINVHKQPGILSQILSFREASWDGGSLWLQGNIVRQLGKHHWLAGTMRQMNDFRQGILFVVF